ncbi:Phox/Bem1p [Macleaya cordata]|uniref:Phox/Bem1p n=1 Tax=Macleaya cordata TaxID=56857 RepID=A0A200QSV5_MACCD|nr:Phox/Bem1p [Macleaya cordata]
MAGRKIIAICQSGGGFVTNKDGSLSYSGGDAHAIDIDQDTQFDDFKSEISEMWNCSNGAMTIKYFLPGNKKTLITISNDKDLKRMISFHGNSVTADVYVVPGEAAVHGVSTTPASRSSRTTASKAMLPVDVPVDNALDTPVVDIPVDKTPDASLYIKHHKAAKMWENTITGVNQRFSNAHEFRDALRKYSIAHGFAYVLKKNDSHRVTVKCKSEGCPWRIHASRLSTTQLFCIKRMNPTHTCGGAVVTSGYQATTSWIAGIIKEKLRESPNYKPKDIADDLKRDFGIELKYAQAWRGKEIAREQLLGSYEEAYSQLPFFCEKIMETNPGSLATFTTKEDSSFHRLFVSFHASLCVSTSRSITFVADIKKGLRESIAEIFENGYHSYCLRYLTENFKKVSHEVKRLLVSEFYVAAYAPRLEGFRRSIESIKCISPEAYNWVLGLKAENWANAYFGGARYNHMTSNFAESFYSWVSEAHELPITQLVDVIRGKIMELIYERRLESSQWITRLTPSMEENLQKETLKAHSLEVLFSPGSTFDVRGDAVYSVDIDRWDCTCKEWQIMGLPCCHAIAVFECIGRNPYDYCSRYFTTESYRVTYSESINPVPNIERLVEKDSAQAIVKVTPPPTRRLPGRPKMKRVVTQELVKRQLQCSKCKCLGHNKTTCKESS